MSRRQKQWARRTLDAQRESLGGVCQICGSNDNLEMDCIAPMGDKHHKMSTDQRASFYRRQLMASNVQLLCKDCHMIKTIHEQLEDETQPAISRNRKFVGELGRRLASLGDWRGPVTDNVAADSTGESEQATKPHID